MFNHVNHFYFKIGFMPILISLSISFSANAEVYKWRDSRGITQYSDKPPTKLSYKPTQKLIRAVLDEQSACTIKSPAKNTGAKKLFNMNFFSTTMKPSTSTFGGLATNNSTNYFTQLSRSTSWIVGGWAKPSSTVVKNRPRTVSVATATTNLSGTTNTTTTSTTQALTVVATAPTATTTVTSGSTSTTSYLPVVDVSLTPFGSSGFSDLRIRYKNELAKRNTDGTGQFRTVCDYTHMNNDDALIFPNILNASHNHTYFGNTFANANSTPDSLSTTGNSSCRGGIANRSAYWVPSMIDTKTKAPIAPKVNVIYYKTDKSSEVTVPPKGLRMIAGNSKSTTEQQYITRYTCNEDYNTRKPHVPACTIGSTMQYLLHFPDCWDAKNLDSPDHKSHMAYSNGASCPATHPVRVPQITYNVHFDVKTDPINWRLASDNYQGAGGFSLHGDWINGWDQTILTEFVNNCLKASKDCHAHLIGDNREIY